MPKFKNVSGKTLNSTILREAGVDNGTVAPDEVVTISEDLSFVVEAAGIQGLVLAPVEAEKKTK